jgi:hypothetical protein
MSGRLYRLLDVLIDLALHDNLIRACRLFSFLVSCDVVGCYRGDYL